MGLSITAMCQLRGESGSSVAIVAGIQRGDEQAILEAGKSGEVAFIPQLLEYRSKAGKHSNFQGVAIQLALAKLGQPAELRQIRCELLFGSPSVRHDAVDKLVYVGGWFSVQAITEVLDNPEYRVGGDGRGTFAPPGSYAVQKLPTIVPNAPAIESGISLPTSQVDIQSQRQWKEWIEAHRDSLNKIPPTGEGVETSSNMCRNILKHDRTFNHEAIKSGK
jgi:hypothetical protein